MTEEEKPVPTVRPSYEFIPELKGGKCSKTNYWNSDRLRHPIHRHWLPTMGRNCSNRLDRPLVSCNSRLGMCTLGSCNSSSGMCRGSSCSTRYMSA